MPTLNLSIKINSADSADFTKRGKHQSLINASKLVAAIACGSKPNSTVSVAVSSSDPVASTGTITCASVADSDTVTVAGTVLTAKTSPSGSAQWARGVSDTADAAALVACINAHATVSLYVTAANVAGVVTLTSNVRGVIGNLIALASSSNTTLAKSGTFLTGGTGGVVGTPTTFGA